MYRGFFSWRETTLQGRDRGESRVLWTIGRRGEMRIHRIVTPGAKDIASHVCLQLGLRGSSSRGDKGLVEGK
jgi:hypothetical protein